MDMANVKRMVLAHAQMDSMEIPVQVYLYHLGQTGSSEFMNFMSFLSIIFPRLIHQANKIILIYRDMFDKLSIL